MLFDERWGIRTDFRYFTGLTDEGETDPADILDPADLLGDTSFWRYNLGVAYRW
jgi:hypothetical protein